MALRLSKSLGRSPESWLAMQGAYAHLHGAFGSLGCRAGAEVRINGVVHLKTVLPPDETVPIGWIAVGDPCRILPPGEHEEIWAIQEPLDFPKTVFGHDRPARGETIMPLAMSRYAASLGKHHRADRIIEKE